MSTRKKLMVLFLMVVFGLMLIESVWGQDMGTAFTYQGRLSDAGSPAKGKYDFEFKLFADPNLTSPLYQVGPTVTKENREITNGTFTVTLDFGTDAFNGDPRWLEIGVRPGPLADPNIYTTLTPRQKVTPTPYAIYARNSGGDNDWTVAGDDMYAALSGNVGVGTLNPSERFEVAGGAIEALDQENTYWDTLGSGVYGWQSFTAGITGKLTRIEIYYQDNISDTLTVNIYSGEGTGGALLHSDSMSVKSGFSWNWLYLSTPIEIFADEKYTLEVEPGISSFGTWAYGVEDVYKGGRANLDSQYDFAFRTYVTNPATALAATADGNVYLAHNDDGFVGIGTENPRTKLHVTRPSGSAILFVEGEGSGKLILGGSMHPVDEKYFFISGYGDELGFGIINDGFSHATSLMTIIRNGNVGIGTNIPAADFHVNSNATVGSNSDGSIIFGFAASNHLTFDYNEIQAKSSVTDETTLYLNYWGGNVNIASGGGAIYTPSLYNTSGGATSAYVKVDSTGKLFAPTSSARYKENIRPLQDNFEKIFKIEPKKFHMKGNDWEEIGYIAEDFDQAGLNNLVVYDSEGRPENVRYELVSLYLLEVVKEKNESLKKLEDQVKTLTKRIEAIEANLKK